LFMFNEAKEKKKRIQTRGPREGRLMSGGRGQPGGDERKGDTDTDVKREVSPVPLGGPNQKKRKKSNK